MDNLKNQTLENVNNLQNDIKFMNKLNIPQQNPCHHNHQTVDTMIDSMIDSYIKSRKSLSNLDQTIFQSHPCYFDRTYDNRAAGDLSISQSPVQSLDLEEQSPRSPSFVTPRQLFHNTKTSEMRVLFSRSDESLTKSPKIKRTTFNEEVVFHDADDEVKQEVGKNDRIIVKKDKEKESKQSTPRKLKTTKSVTDISLVVFERKFLILAEKILDSLNEIRLILSNGIPLPDGEEDAQRRLTRLKEFSSRFSRNNLYSLGRNISELETPKCNIINQKMLTCYQLVLNGFQSYQNHLPSSIGDAAADKITQFINYFNKLADIHKTFTPLPDKEGVLELIQAFKMNSDVIVQQLISLNNPHMKRGLFSAVSTSDLNLAAKKVKSQGKRTKPKRNSNNIFSRYSMYGGGSSFKSETMWKKTVEYLAKKKYNVKSRYRQTNSSLVAADSNKITSNNLRDYKSNSTVSKNCSSYTTQVQSKSSESYNGSKCPNNTANENVRQVRHQSCNAILNEDNIQTLVQLENSEETPQNQEKDQVNERGTTEIINTDKQMTMIHGKIATQLYELVQNSKVLSDNLKDYDEINSERKIYQLIDDCMKNDEGKLVLGKLFTELVRNSDKPLREIDLDFLKDNNIKLNLENETKKKERKPPKIKETGEKNARLIIIQDENSIIDEDSLNQSKLNKPPNQDNRFNGFHENAAKNTAETQTTIKTVNRVSRATQKASLKTIKISRLEKKLNTLKMLPKNYALNVIQYKIDFKNHCRNNLMYRRNEKIQPVNLMNRISDEIFDYSLAAVTKEMEKMNLAERIYRSELMY